MADVLRLIKESNNGRVLEALSGALAEALAATAHFGGESTVSLKIKTTLEQAHIDARGTNRISVGCDVDVRPAKAKTSPTSFFVDAEMRISTRDPAQLSLENLKRVDDTAKKALDNLSRAAGEQEA